MEQLCIGPQQNLRGYRDALGCFATGVTVITARRRDGTTAGVTINSFSSVSLTPPLVLWSLAETAPSCTTFSQASHFAVHVLAEEQEAMAAHFARPSDDKFARFDCQPGLGGAPILPDVAAVFECSQRYPSYGGDHRIFMGTVERFSQSDKGPLLFHRGKFRTLGPPAHRAPQLHKIQGNSG